METSEVLYAAADLIEERGWGTGSWVTSGPLCLEGAIAAARGITNPDRSLENRCPAYYAVRGYLNETPFTWNDRLKHTLAREYIEAGDLVTWGARAQAEGQVQVVAVLRAAALLQEARERVEVSA